MRALIDRCSGPSTRIPFIAANAATLHRIRPGWLEDLGAVFGKLVGEVLEFARRFEPVQPLE